MIDDMTPVAVFEEARAVKSIPTFLSLLIFGFLYECLLLYDTLAQKNMMQLIGLCFYATCLFIYTAIQWDEIQKTVKMLNEFDLLSHNDPTWSQMKPLLTANACITAIYVLFISFVAWKLYDEFRWKIFKQLNADLAVQRRYFAFKVRILERWSYTSTKVEGEALTLGLDLYHAPQV